MLLTQQKPTRTPYGLQFRRRHNITDASAGIVFLSSFLLLFRARFSIMYCSNYGQKGGNIGTSERSISRQAMEDIDESSRGDGDFFPFPRTLVRGQSKEIPVREMTSLQLLQGDGWASRTNKVHCRRKRGGDRVVINRCNESTVPNPVRPHFLRGMPC